jgi:transcriptional regulator with XRE-family HTH domain
MKITNNVKFRQSIHAKPYIAVRDFLKIKKKEEGLSNRKFAKRLNVIYSLISKIETGDRRLDVVEACKYCKALNVDPHELIDIILDNLEE